MMNMDLSAVIEEMETGDQDSALTALQSYNKQMNQCFTFNRDEQKDREEGKLQKLKVHKHWPNKMLSDLDSIHCSLISQEEDAGGDKEETGLCSKVLKESSPPSENPDQEVIVEALKSICNILLHNETGQMVAADLQLIKGVAERLKQCHDPTWNYEVRFFDLRLTFLLTALRVDVRAQLAQELHGVSLLGNHLEATLGLCCSGTLETARAGFEGIPTEELPPLSRQQTELAMEILKILFNITFDINRRKVDEEEAAVYRHLGAILRHCLMSHADGEERTEEFHSHTVNLLGNLPLPCLDVLLMPKVQQGSIEYMGVNMDAVNTLLKFMEKRLDRGHKLKETLLPSLNLLTESARIHRETRKFLRSKVLPPLRDVKNRPEVGNTLRNKIVRLMTLIDTDVKDCAAEFLFVLCKESVSRFIKYTGYGNAAGLLAARGLLRGGKDPGIYSEDEDSETEEYREAKAQINPITGVVEEEQPNPMEGMTEEQKEYEAMKLVHMFDKLSRNHLIQPMQLGMDGTMTEMTTEDLHKLTNKPLLQSEDPPNLDSEDEN
ncbi:chaperone Ric-8A [Pundamilia nyererei]|uniref:Synembryn n=1 Tax=Pundamilia nyererei TaxID=303518 RepID=A0A9Y3S3C9_9CICH|nr:PREDICTED: synembryn-A-like [Pundamilia nyererei]